ncbi:MAG: SpoIIE family protein phosphatase [Acidobacteriota bacterium]|nr:SpoIIE family protein phosphatase [Acidobacteriota bacterium]
MLAPRQPDKSTADASLVVINPSGNRTRVAIEPLPFLIGRHQDNNLVLRDNRASRNHARIVLEGKLYFVEDLNSRHGVYVNGQKVKRQQLANSDRIDFGHQDSYKLLFTLEESEIHRMMEQISTSSTPSVTGGGSLAKLRALVEVARALQSSLTTEEVLASVVDAALAVTGTERGFLLLRKDHELEVTVARDSKGKPLPSTDLKVPMSLINRALRSRRELLSMSFDPLEQQGMRPDLSVANLELRSVVCLPLVHVRTGSSQDTIVSSVEDTVGLLYMDSRLSAADLSGGNREILQTLALEASTILENARLLQEERAKERIEEELRIARQIQQSLLPSGLPSEGWFRAAGSSIASHQVGGDYFDVKQLTPDVWATVVADVSGKGVSSALLASLLQGAFLLACHDPVEIGQMMSRINRFLNERTKGEKYATAFYCTIDQAGMLQWANAAHPKPYLVRTGSELTNLDSTGLPLGMLEIGDYGVRSMQLLPGDKIVIYSDGLSEAENGEGEFFDKKGLAEAIQNYATLGCVAMLKALTKAVEDFTEQGSFSDDITIVVLEYQP